MMTKLPIVSKTSGDNKKYHDKLEQLKKSTETLNQTVRQIRNLIDS